MLSGFALRSLERIDLTVFFFSASLQVGRHIAGPGSPFDGRIREYKAIGAGGKIFGFLAAFTLLNNGMAGAAIKLAAFLLHEGTIIPLFYACTNQFNHILSLKNLDLKNGFMPHSFFVVK